MTHKASKPETVLVTGGTGSFGQAFTRYLLAHTDARVRVLSRDEHKQQAMMRAGLTPGQRLTYILGDVRDVDKLWQACDGVSVVVHAAALKTVPGGEHHVDEFIQTNIVGTLNVARAATLARVPRCLLVSTDKACQPINAYGKTKAVAEAAWIQANARGVSRGARFAAVRGGNIWASNGSVARVWREALDKKRPVTVNGVETTRFHLEMEEWCEFIWRQVRGMRGGEIFVPRARAWRLGDLAEAFALPAETTTYAEPREGDKAHEVMVGKEESHRTLGLPGKLVICPPVELREVYRFELPEEAEERWVTPGWEFTSEGAERMGVEELRALVSSTKAHEGKH